MHSGSGLCSIPLMAALQHPLMAALQHLPVEQLCAGAELDRWHSVADLRPRSADNACCPQA